MLKTCPGWELCTRNGDSLTDKDAWHSPSIPSTDSCRPRLCCGFTTQWLLVAVMSNTSHPSSAAQIVRESSRNKSESLKKQKGVIPVTQAFLWSPCKHTDTCFNKAPHLAGLSSTGRLCPSWAGVLFPLITFRWSTFLPFKKGRMGWSRVEVVLDYFAATV